MGRDKATLAIGAQTMGSMVAGVLRSTGIQRVVAVGEPAPPELEVLSDTIPGAGPLAALINAVDRLGDIVVCPCDVPWIAPAVIRSILIASATSDAPAVIARSPHPQPLIGMYRHTALSALAEAWVAGERSVRGALAGLEVSYVDVAAGQVVNVNTPQDLAAGIERHGPNEPEDSTTDR